ncbi:MAG: hypothetical protein ACHQF2_04975 [Flavobacteriales bacterium]
MNEYKNLLKLDRDNPKYNYQLGLCYLNTNVDKTLAVTYLERSHKTEKAPSDILFHLGQAYAFAYNFDKAIETLEEHLKKASGKEKEKTQKLLDNCKTAKEMMLKPINVTFEIAGDAFNTEYPDYYPFVSGDETFIAFNSRRKTTKAKLEFDGYYNCDIYTSAYNGETYATAKDVGNKLNSMFDDQVVGISPEGDYIFIFSQAQETYGALYLVKRQGNLLGKKEQFITAVNDEKAIETSGYMSPDGQTIVFASNRSGGQGGFDLWMVRKLPTGKWAIPQNLGPEVNTSGDEDFPSFSFDGTTLYFSSNGHAGCGGFDLFKIDWNPEDNTYSNMRNMGYPLNTPYDERTISFTQDNHHAYISALRKGGKGDLDIYRVTFSDIQISPAIFNIKLPTGDDAKPFINNAVIFIFSENGDAVGEYRPNGKTGKFTIALLPGTYNAEVRAEGYAIKTEKIKVTEFSVRTGVIEKLIMLDKK